MTAFKSISMILFVFLLPASAGYAAQELDSVSVINKAARQACSLNPDKKSCERLVWMTAKVAMINTGFYMKTCNNKQKIPSKDRKNCENAASLMQQLSTIK